MEFKLFVKDMEWYVLLVSILLSMLCRRITNSSNMYVLYVYSGMDILSSCFLCLVQDAAALPICRAFVATAKVLPRVNPLEPDVSLKSRCRISTAVPT